MLAVLSAPAVAGEQVVPKNGTYSGAGALEGNPTYRFSVGLTLKGGMVKVTAAEFSFPGCSGGVSFPDVALGSNRFATSSTSTNSESNLMRGRWVDKDTVRGKIVLSRPNDASCGDQGTWIYRFRADRYGRA